jgi:hypothetical protein
MYIKFLKHGKGDPAKAASYLIDEVDHLNRPRADVQVLRGDPHTFTAIAESIQNEWKYTSGVIAWSKDDAPTNDEIDQVLEAFEKHAFSGLKPNQYHFTAVLHEEDDGSKHVHFLVPRIELDTGKALNIAPPGHEKYFDPLRDYFNYSKGWSRPDDPTLQHDTQTPDHAHFQDAAAIRAGLKGKSVNDIREVVGSLIEQRIYFDFIKDRADVLDAVSELGEVTRISDKFISLKLDGADKAIRLKGAFYESEFSVESYFENRTRETSDARASRENRFIPEEHKKLAEQLEKRFTELAGGRSKYNSERYQSLERSQIEPNFDPKRESQFSPILTTASERNSQSFEPAGTAAQAAKKPIRSIEQHEPRDSRNSQDQENPFYIKYGFSFDSSYVAYIEYQSRLRQQEQIQRHKRDAEQSRIPEIRRGESEYSEVWNREGLALVRTNRPDQAALQEQLRSSAGNQLNESRSAVIENYRRTAESIEATTARARESTATYSTAISDYRTVKELHEHFKREAQRSSEDRAEISADRAESIRTDYLRKFFTNYSRELESTATKAFERFSTEFTDRESSQKFNSEQFAEFGENRDRKPIEADDRASHQENEFSRAISTKISGVNPTSIFTALDQLDQRREFQRAQERENDRGYDSPSPF